MDGAPPAGSSLQGGGLERAAADCEGGAVVPPSGDAKRLRKDVLDVLFPFVSDDCLGLLKPSRPQAGLGIAPSAKLTETSEKELCCENPSEEGSSFRSDCEFWTELLNPLTPTEGFVKDGKSGVRTET